MRTLFLSFNDRYFKPLLCGIKKYEYRKRFCYEETICYLYLSGKTRKVIGILELGRPIKLEEIVDQLESFETSERVKRYLKSGIKNAIPIKKLSLFKNAISIEKLKKEFAGFVPPQMYYDLDKKKDLLQFLERQKVDKTIVIHKHDKIYYDNLCVSVKELEKTEEYKNRIKDYEYLYFHDNK